MDLRKNKIVLFILRKVYFTTRYLRLVCSEQVGGGKSHVKLTLGGPREGHRGLRNEHNFEQKYSRFWGISLITPITLDNVSASIRWPIIPLDTAAGQL